MRIHKPACALLWVIAIGLLAAVGFSRAGAEDRARRDGSYTYFLTTPGLQLTPAEDGSVGIELEGFRSRPSRPGFPDVPTKTVLVAIPPGAVPRLEVRRTGRQVLRDLRPRPMPRFSADPLVLPVEPEGRLRRPESAPREIYEADAEAYAAPGLAPARLAWLGRVGVLRDQRYVELHLAPVRYDGSTGGVRIETAIEATVHFEGATVPTGRPRVEPTFEAVYRAAFDNYAQGRRFRLSAGPAVEPVAAAPLPGGPRYKIRLDRNGIVRLDHALVSAAAAELLQHDPATWKLTSQGVQVPLEIRQSGVDPGLLEPGEWVQFYGQAYDLEPNSVLNYEALSEEQHLWEARDFSDENVYFLTVDAEVQPSMTERDATAVAEPPAGPYFYDVAHEEVDDAFWPAIENHDAWYWKPVLSEGNSRLDSVPLPGLFSGTLPARVRVRLRGALFCRSEGIDHRTAVRLRNSSLETLVLPDDNPDNQGNENVGAFDGPTVFTHDFEWTHSALHPELTDPVEVELRALPVALDCQQPSNYSNEVYLDWIEVDYARELRAAGDRLNLRWEDGAPTRFEIPGFDSPNVEVYEVTHLLPDSFLIDAVRLTGVEILPDGGRYTVRFRVDDDPALAEGTPRSFVVLGEGATSSLSPSSLIEDRVSDLRQDTTPADLVVVAHPDLLDSRCSEGGNSCATDNDCGSSASDVCEVHSASALAQLLAVRAAEGISSRVARLPDVEDEFNHGLSGPLAIKNFLAWLASGGWSGPPPTYVMLLGDGSYDYKGGAANGSFVPTQMVFKPNLNLPYFASDNLLTTVVGEDLSPDMAIGRVSVRTLAEAEAVLQKILDYSSSAPDGSWRRNSLLVSDRANDFTTFEAENFEYINRLALDALEGTPYTSHNLRYWSDNCASPPGSAQNPVCNPEATKQDLRDAIHGLLEPGRDGVALVQFTGHGNFDLWSSDILFCADDENPSCSVDETTLLFNDLRLPWVIVHNCLSGGFHTVVQPKSLSEQWMKREGGGSVAFFAPSGLGFRFLGEAVTRNLWGSLFGPTKQRRLAVPVLTSLVELCAQAGDNTIEACQFYTLMGDPSMTLLLPHVDPPRAVEATAGNQQVDLSWTASATADAVYDIYRKVGVGTYQKANAVPVMGTTYTDEGTLNTNTYQYYVVALDPEGFESAWSNFNTDCGDPDPEDCVEATPINLEPPVVPTGLSATDPESGGRLELSWTPNPESDIDSYTVHYGTTVALGDTLIVRFGTEASLTGLENNTDVFIALQATNTSGVASGVSQPIAARATFVLGLKAPRFVGDLKLARSGEDAVLTWGPVTTDIYGKPTAVSHYEVFRGTDPAFSASEPNRIGSPPEASFNDGGALAPTEPDRYYYLVRAVDGVGNRGGIGNQLPAPILDLTIAEQPDDRILISWSPVTTDFDGAPALVSHYELYAADQPFSRGDIRDGLLAPLAPVLPGNSVEIEPPAQDRYYSVLAVDAKGNRSPF